MHALGNTLALLDEKLLQTVGWGFPNSTLGHPALQLHADCTPTTPDPPGNETMAVAQRKTLDAPNAPLRSKVLRFAQMRLLATSRLVFLDFTFWESFGHSPH